MLQPSLGPQRNFSPAANSFVRDMTDTDLSSHLGPVGARGGMYIQFFWVKIRIENEAEPALHGTFQNRLCIAKCPKGDNRTIAHRFISEEQAMREYPQEYAMFSQAESIPTSGTPLQELPGISTSQIALLTLYNLRCIEDLAEAPQEIINPMGMDAISAYALAKRWTASKSQNSDLITASQNDAITSTELARLRASEEASRRTIAELSAQLEVVMKMNGQMQAPQSAPVSAGVVPMMNPASSDLAPLPESALFSGSGGAAMGNDDLNGPAEPTQADPLGLKRKAR